jgi:hypothetical protein
MRTRYIGWVLGFKIETGQVESCAILNEKSFRLIFKYSIHFCDIDPGDSSKSIWKIGKKYINNSTVAEA